jgi:large subunit ribosomal protein L15
MPLQRRLPKRGFTNIFKKQYNIISVKDLSRFAPNSSVDADVLKEAGLVKKVKDGIKILGGGDISHPVTVRAHMASKTAKEKIEAAGGKVEVI